MPLTFVHPELLLLLLLLPLVWSHLTCRRWTRQTVLRLVAAGLLLLVPSGPRIRTTPPGRDLIVLVDRSASCGDAAASAWRELRGFVTPPAGSDDRLAIIGFGRDAVIERSFSGAGAGEVTSDTAWRDGSDIAAAVTMADAMRDRTRRTAALLLSDGRWTGPDPALAPGASAFPLWYRLVGTTNGPDVAAGEISLPDSVTVGSAWPVALTVTANRSLQATYRLWRNGQLAAEGRIQANEGETHLVFQDGTMDERIVRYDFQVETPGDEVGENNRSQAILPIGTDPRVLLVRNDGQSGIVAGSLIAGGFDVTVVRPEDMPSGPAGLVPYGLVILEDCRLVDVPEASVAELAALVRGGISSLLVTGGPNSFGSGGYHRSVLDPLLPVELELRTTTRRGAMAVAFALDRSGSMSVMAGHDRSKMDLANLGAAESIRLLAPVDEAAVIAVDSSAHVVIPLSRVDDPEALTEAALRVQAMGGGIYTMTALRAAARELEKSTLNNRHIILFADADDAEEQEGCIAFARDLQARGIGLSVVAMGTAAATDSAFLRELAAGGGGEALFSADAGGLPALFTSEVMRLSRRGFLEEPVQPLTTPSWQTLGLPGEVFPALAGFNIASARDGASLPLRLDDEFSSPILAVRRWGGASVGAALFALDGEFAGRFSGWPGASRFIVSLARNLLPGAGTNEAKAWTRSSGDGTVAEGELSPGLARAVRSDVDGLHVRWLGPGGREVDAQAEWNDPEHFQARLERTGAGTFLPLVTLPDGTVVMGPPATVSYSPEFRIRSSSVGARELERLAVLSDGGLMVDPEDVLRSARAETVGERDLTGWVIAAALCAFLAELAARRRLW